jgi:hypothetical protein
VLPRSISSQPEKARELVAKIAVEKYHDKFTALIKELNRLLDGDPLSPSTNRTSIALGFQNRPDITSFVESNARGVSPEVSVVPSME